MSKCTVCESEAERQGEHRQNGILSVWGSIFMGERESESGYCQTPRGRPTPERGTSYRDVKELKQDLGLDQDKGLVDFDLRGFRGR